MGPVELDGLPAHVLLVHAVVIVVPTAALCVLLTAWWGRARRWLGMLTPLATAAALALVPVTVNAGEWLEERVGVTPLVERHTELGEQMLPWGIALFVAGVVVWAWHRTPLTARLPFRRTISLALAVAATVVAVGTVVHVYRVGESGSRAVWEGSFSSSPR